MYGGYRDHYRNRFKQTHGGRKKFPDSSWGASSEFGRNSEYHESDSSERRPFDMDNYYSGRQFSVGGVDFEKGNEDDWDEYSNREYNRSRFADPYGGQGYHDRVSPGSQFTSQDDYNSFVGKGPKNYKKSDERIREEVCETLYRSPYVDARGIEVSVQDGCVTLRGTVESRYVKREAESCIENLSGVVDVQNELRLMKSRDGGFFSDSINPSNQGESEERPH